MIITISGQYGSGGDQVGVRLAELLNYKLWDSELIIRAKDIYDAEYSDTVRPIGSGRSDAAYCQDNDVPDWSILYKQAEIALQADLMFSDMINFEEWGPESTTRRKAMLDAQTRAVLECAEGGNCILFSKCSSYILRDHPDAVHAFSTASMEIRIMRIMNTHNIVAEEKRHGKKRLALTNAMLARKMINMDRDAAKDLINKTDKRRADYHEFITGEKWGHPMHFDFHISGNKLDYMEEQTELFLNYIREEEKSRQIG